MILSPAKEAAIATLANYFKSLPTPPAAIQSAQARSLRSYEWMEKHFWIAMDDARPKLIELLPHQKVILYLFFEPSVAQALTGFSNFQTLVYSTVKKSGKTAIASAVARWVTETWGSHVETYALANDLEQARGRIYAAALASIELDPRYSRSAKGIPELWRIIEREAAYLPTHSKLKAVSSDYKGEAGSNPVATFWSELWGYATEASQRLWEELTPVPTRPRSIRYVETYAGYDGESSILNDLEDRVKKEGRRLEHEELDELLKGSGLAWPAEWRDQKLPFFVHAESLTIAYWDEGVEARRMPWQTQQYYVAQAGTLRQSAFDRLHLNYRVSAVDQFIDPSWWARLYDETAKGLDHKQPAILGLDASVSGDCSAASVVTRNPSKPDETLARFGKIWTPPGAGRPLDYSVTIEPYVRKLCTGHIHPLREKCDSHSKIAELGPCKPEKPYNIVQIAYDPFQLHDMMMRFRNEAVAWVEPFNQQQDRSKADKGLFDAIRDQTIHHSGDPDLAEHLQNCGARIPKDDNTRLRLVKKAEKSKIDYAVATSMANHICRKLNLY